VQNLLDSVNALGHVIHVDIEDRKFTVEGICLIVPMNI
jgi:hypothetical protein